MQISRLWRTTTFRLTTGFGVVFALGVIVLLGMVYLQTAGYLTRRVDRTLSAEAAALSQSRPDDIIGRIGERSAHDPLSRFGLFSAAGEPVAGTIANLPSQLPVGGGPRDLPVRRGDNPERGLAVRLPWGEVLVVERDIAQLVELRRIIFSALFWSGVAIAGLGLVLGVTLSLRPLQRVTAFQAATDAIASGDFARRLPIAGGHDELDELAGIVNAMMDEIERLVTLARTVGESVAHELRTPLTRLRTTLDHAKAELAADDPRRVLLETCVAETEGVLTRFRALLRIAAVEARRRQLEIRPVRLDFVVEQVVELYRPLASERRLALETRGLGSGVAVPADADLLTEAVSNLVDNALKFTPAGGRVIVCVVQAREGPAIAVQDNGPGVPEHERGLLTKRFYRSRRDVQVEGHGLGLSLVEAVAALHGFELSFEDANPGLIVSLVCARPAPARRG